MHFSKPYENQTVIENLKTVEEDTLLWKEYLLNQNKWKPEDNRMTPLKW